METVAERESHGFCSGGTEFKILLRILYVLRELTIGLQMQAIDVTYANQQVTSVISILKKMREDSSSHFHTLFTETTQLGQQLHGDQFELSTPRTVGWQVHRSNPETSSPEDYFQITLFDEFLMLFLSLRIGLLTIQLIPLLSPKCVCTTFSDAVYRV